MQAWLKKCQDSVVNWAVLRGFEYKFIDDSFFDILPYEFRKKHSDNILPISDLCRLLWIERFLQRSNLIVLWIDIDVLVFSPNNFVINFDNSYSFCHEVWPGSSAKKLTYDRRTNNSVMYFKKENPILDFYIYAAKNTLDKYNQIGPRRVGTSLLRRLNSVLELEKIQSVGLINPKLHIELCTTIDKHARTYVENHGNIIGAANLCLSLLGNTVDEFEFTNESFNLVCKRLLDQEGKVINFNN